MSLSVSVFMLQYLCASVFLCMWDCRHRCTYLYKFVGVEKRRRNDSKEMEVSAKQAR